MESQTNSIEAESKNSTPVFRNYNVDDLDPEVTEIESLCLHCGENGITRLLLTKIPFYKEVVIMSFCCDHCHWMNNELQPAATIQEKGVSYNLEVCNGQDLMRRIVRTEFASVMIPELEFEIPSKTQEGTVTTIEGIIDRSCIGLESKMEYLKVEDVESAAKLEEFLGKLRELKSGNVNFHFVLRDCTGNSFVENLCAPMSDPQLAVREFERDREENLMLGIYAPDADTHQSEQQCEDQSPIESREKTDLRDEVLGFATNCYSCNAPCVTNMKVTPHFKDVVIMATSCDICGHNTNEVKSGVGIDALGIKFELRIEDAKDLSRDLLKSDTCSISVPELDLEMGPTTLGSRYTTVEGILSNIKEQLTERNPLITGDSAEPRMKETFDSFLKKLNEIILGKRKATLILDDPCGNSYLQSIDHPNPDANLTTERYTRSESQDEELGLLDMKVENYEES